MNKIPCPCGSGDDYEVCCRPLHDGGPAPNALALMRSRYSAYALGLIDYILRTQTMEAARQDIEQFCQATTFKGLKILDVQESTVTFTVFLSQGGKDVSFTEKSTFEKVHGRWFYVKGQY